MANISASRKRRKENINDYLVDKTKRKEIANAENTASSSVSELADGATGITSSWTTVSSEIQRLTNLMPKIQTLKLRTPETCTHEVVLPQDIEYSPLVPSSNVPAKEFKFTLDPFQREAVLCIENNQSVLVSAHTSAGKTVVAEYAIALSLKRKQRVIYTTPIKALSNQKYYEMSAEFHDVGLMTGDITINEDASCLIMTTEILRSMLYKGSEVMKEMAWVIFDEIHYMKDKERGVVWEETIILLPNIVRYIFLSATIPNARQFAEWICYLHRQPCHVVYTDFRPTPLQHYVFPAGGDGIHLVVGENGVFCEDNFNSAMSLLKEGDAAKGDQRGRKGGLKGESNCFKIVKLIMEKNMAPVIVFSFSKRDCEDYARQMAQLAFTTTEEEKMTIEIFQNAIDYTLSDDEKDLPQVKGILPLLRKGIGIHHSGLLPVLKEIVEILFSEGLVKVLFATETFSMGLNMPARTVLFTSARKFDGKDFRWIFSGEYIQMSGRAGRRGLDDNGIVILMVDEKMSPGIGKQIIKGQPDPLLSAFRVTYGMVLNLLRMQEINPESMIEKSFYNFQNYSSILELVKKMEKLENDQKFIMVENEDLVVSFRAMQQQLRNLKINLTTFVNQPTYILPFLNPGRLVKIYNGSCNLGWCIVTSMPQMKKRLSKEQMENNSKNKIEELAGLSSFLYLEKPLPESASSNECPQPSSSDEMTIFTVEVLAHLSNDAFKANTCAELMPCPVGEKGVELKPCPFGEKGEMSLIKVELNSIFEISAIRLEKMPQNLKSVNSRVAMLKTLQVLLKQFPSGFPLLDPIKDMHVKEEKVKILISRMNECHARLVEHPLYNSEQVQLLSKQYEKKMKIQSDIAALKSELQRHPFFSQIEELKQRKRVLRRLGYVKHGDVIQLKGQAACEISSGDELLLTELLFNGVFNTLTPEEACSLLSCFVYQEGSFDRPNLTEPMVEILKQMQGVARRVAKVSIDARLPMDEEKYIESFRPDMMEVINAWCKGSSFLQICEITEIYEGSIIRCIRRLQETLLQMYHASKGIGNAELEIKFCKGIATVKRNIVNACSLYLPKEA